MDNHAPLTEPVRLAKIRWRVEHDYRELRTGRGPDHLEGHSFIGWQRHVTLTALAQAFCIMLRLDPTALDAILRHRAATPARRHRWRRPPVRPNGRTTRTRNNITKYY